MRAFFPLNGQGQRFKEVGYTLPKPLIEARSIRLLTWAHSSLSQLTLSRSEYLCAQSLVQHPLFRTLQLSGCFHILSESTIGPVQTVLQAISCLETEEDCLVVDCDSFLDPVELAEAIQLFRETEAEGGVTIRKTDDPSCSYVEVDAQWWVRSARERDPYTMWSSTGPYWFRTGFLLQRVLRQAAQAQMTGIAETYNFLERVKAMPVASFRHLGSPDLLTAFEEG